MQNGSMIRSCMMYEKRSYQRKGRVRVSTANQRHLQSGLLRPIRKTAQHLCQCTSSEPQTDRKREREREKRGE